MKTEKEKERRERERERREEERERESQVPTLARKWLPPVAIDRQGGEAECVRARVFSSHRAPPLRLPSSIGKPYEFTYLSSFDDDSFATGCCV
jgi:hypothetical protein